METILSQTDGAREMECEELISASLRIFTGPKRPKFSLLNVPDLPPNVVTGQVDVLLAQGRRVMQHAVAGRLAGFT